VQSIILVSISLIFFICVALALPRNFRISEDGVKLRIINLRKDYEEGTTDLMVIQCNASNVHGSAFAAGYINVLSEF